MSVNEWSYDELLKLFKDPTTEKQLNTRSDVLIAKAEEAGKTDLANFLSQANKKLRASSSDVMNNPLFRDQALPVLLDAAMHETLPTDSPGVKVQGPDRANNKEAVGPASGIPRETQLPTNLEQQTVFESPFQQGSINPILVQKYKRTVLLDSTFRANSLPYVAGDVYGPSSSTNYHATLTETLRNTTSLKLQSISIPRVWDNFSCAIGNTVIGVGCYDGGLGTVDWFSLPDGYYTRAAMEAAPIQLTYEGVQGAPPSLSLQLIQDGENSFITLHYEAGAVVCPTHDYRLVLYADSMSTCGDSEKAKCYSSSSMNRNLGASLGFLPEKDSDIIAGADGRTYITLEGGVYADPVWSITAAIPPDLIGIKYFLVVLDDYNSNRVNNSIVSISGPATKIRPRSMGSLQCVRTDEGISEPLFTITNPRSRPRNVIYAENQKLLSLTEADIGSDSPNLGNVLCLCPIPNGDVGTIMSLTGSSVNSTDRIYFGPVSLEKVKVTLLDDAGRIVDLKGHNWSMSLVAEQLYQF